VSLAPHDGEKTDSHSDCNLERDLLKEYVRYRSPVSTSLRAYDLPSYEWSQRLQSAYRPLDLLCSS
jgi:hypothetical protein